jgi:hypothetical protein
MMRETRADQVLYLYGVVPAGRAVSTAGGAVLEVVPFSSLVAIVEPVPRDEFSPEVLEDKLQCVEWVAPLACKHTAVLDEIMRHGPVVPAPLCTLFSSASALAAALAERAQRFRDALRLLDGRQEWSCKLFYDEARLRAVTGANDPGVRALESAAVTASPGKAYVLRKQRDARLAEVVELRIDAVVEDIVAEVDPEIADVRFRALLAEAATGRPEPMALNAAVLVDVERTSALHATVGALSVRLGDEGFALELTGPWPPYSFCDGSPADAGELE